MRRPSKRFVYFLLSLGCIAVYISEVQKLFVYPARGRPNGILMYFVTVLFGVLSIMGYILFLGEGGEGWWRRFWMGCFPRVPMGGKPLPKCKECIKTEVHKKVKAE